MRFNHGEKALYSEVSEDSEWGVVDADSVFVMNEDLGLYLICSSTSGRPRGVEGVSYMYFNLVRLMGNSFRNRLDLEAVNFVF